MTPRNRALRGILSAAFVIATFVIAVTLPSAVQADVRFASGVR